MRKITHYAQLYRNSDFYFIFDYAQAWKTWRQIPRNVLHLDLTDWVESGFKKKAHGGEKQTKDVKKIQMWIKSRKTVGDLQVDHLMVADCTVGFNLRKMIFINDLPSFCLVLSLNFIPYLGSRHKVIQNLFAPRCLLVGYSWIWRCAVTDEHGQLNSSSGLNLSFFSDQYLSRFDLKELSDGLSATYDGRPFHSFTTLCEKELCLNLDFTCFFCSLNWWPLVTVTVVRWKKLVEAKSWDLSFLSKTKPNPNSNPNPRPLTFIYINPRSRPSPIFSIGGV